MVTDILRVVLKARWVLGVMKRPIVGAVKRAVRRRNDMLSRIEKFCIQRWAVQRKGRSEDVRQVVQVIRKEVEDMGKGSKSICEDMSHGDVIRFR